MAVDFQPTLTLDNLVNAGIALVAVGFAWRQYRRSQSARVFVDVAGAKMTGDDTASLQLLVSNAGSASAWQMVIRAQREGPWWYPRGLTYEQQMIVKGPVHPGRDPVPVTMDGVPADMLRVVWGMSWTWIDPIGLHKGRSWMAQIEPEDHVPLVMV